MSKKSFYLFVLIFIAFAICSCKKEEIILQIPEVTTFSVTDVTYHSASCGGSVSSDGSAIISRGVCLSTKPIPTIADSISITTKENGSFTMTLNNLKSDSTYYIRAYATNNVGTGYGSIMQFKTKHASINVVTAPLSDISYQSAFCGGSVAYEGTSINACGICWSTKAIPTLADSITVDSNEPGSFTSIMKSLKPDFTYYVRAYATNGIDTVYGSTMKFKTKRASMSVTTSQANMISHNSAICGGSISTASGVTLTKQGVCWGLSAYPTIEDYVTTVNSTSNSFSATLSNLQPNTFYYARAYASSYNEIIYGNNISFKTRKTTLSITDLTLDNITPTSVDYNGTLTSEEPTLITAQGVCWSSSSTPTITDNTSTLALGNGAFSSSIRELKANTTYYLRAYATDDQGTVYSNTVMFTTGELSIEGTPSVKTLPVNNPKTTNPTAQGQIINEGNAPVTSYGYYCSDETNPTASNSTWTYNTGTTTSTFSMSIYGLKTGVRYYVRAFAKNSYGIGYGNVIAFVH